MWLALVAGVSGLANAANVTGSPFATVWKLSGEITASESGGSKARVLREGDQVHVGERVKSGALAEAVLKTEDAGLVAIRQNAEFVVERYSASGSSTDQSTMRLISGSLRLVTGWIGKINRDGHRVLTATSTIGIRGTDHEPFVLAGDLAKQSGSAEGTYDKVNRGGTTLSMGENRLDIDPGKVGFARAAPKVKDRALMTLLLPVLLDKVPAFYVPGKFDSEVEQYSQNADEISLQLLEQKRSMSGPVSSTQCDGTLTAKTWLANLDGAIGRGDANAVVGMFSSDIVVDASVRGGDGAMTALKINRDDFVNSTIAATKDLKDYKQRRVSLQAHPLTGKTACEALTVKSSVIEQGIQAGKPFRFESLEEYVLENRAGQWLSIKAQTTQR